MATSLGKYFPHQGLLNLHNHRFRNKKAFISDINDAETAYFIHKDGPGTPGLWYREETFSAPDMLLAFWQRELTVLPWGTDQDLDYTCKSDSCV